MESVVPNVYVFKKPQGTNFTFSAFCKYDSSSFFFN